MAESDEGRWLTYRELGGELGCTPNAARMFAHRKKWPKRAAKRVGEPVRVMVPENHIVRGRAMHSAPVFDAQPNGSEQAHEQAAQAFAQAISALTALLNDAIGAERIARDEAAALRHELERLRARRWWQRW